MIIFNAKLLTHGDMDATYVEFPYSVEKLFNTKGQVRVKATIDGVDYRGSLANMGTGCHILVVTKAIRQQIGKTHGDVVSISLEKDDKIREVTIPSDLAALFEKNKAAADFFASLSYTRQKEYVVWITSAKKVETREKRLLQTLDNMINHHKAFR